MTPLEIILLIAVIYLLLGIITLWLVEEFYINIVENPIKTILFWWIVAICFAIELIIYKYNKK